MTLPVGAVPDLATEVVAAPVAPERTPWREALRTCVVVYLAVRVGLLVLGMIAALLPRNPPVPVPGWPATSPSQPWHEVITAWERWDALWYLRIATSGYSGDDGSAAFFPLYPLLSRVAGTLLGGHPLLGAFVVSNAALVAALVVLFRLTELELGTEAARRAVVVICVLPTGFFLFAPYSESLFLLLSVGCLYAARRSHWLLAGALGALASSSRSTGLLLCLPLAVEAVHQSLRQGRPQLRQLLAPLAAAALPVVGVLAYLGYWATRGDWSRPLELQRANWFKVPSMPWETLHAGWVAAVEGIGVPDRGWRTVDLLLVLLLVVSGAAACRRVRPLHTAYFLASVLFPLTLMDPDRPLQSVARYYLVLPVVTWGFVLLARRLPSPEAVVAALALLCGAMAAAFTAWQPVF